MNKLTKMMVGALSAVGLVASGGALANKYQRPGHGSVVTGCSNGYVALTFDDGPDPEFTPKILDELDRLNVKATFFLQGQHVDAHPELAKEIVARGHDVGNHTYNHPHMSKLSLEEVDMQVGAGSYSINQATGVTPIFFRPPFGDTNDVVASTVDSYFQIQVTWTADTFDWRPDRTKEEVVEAALTVEPGGSILMHDTLQVTVDSIPDIVFGLADKGLCLGKFAPSSNVNVDGWFATPAAVMVVPWQTPVRK